MTAEQLVELAFKNPGKGVLPCGCIIEPRDDPRPDADGVFTCPVCAAAWRLTPPGGSSAFTVDLPYIGPMRSAGDE